MGIIIYLKNRLATIILKYIIPYKVQTKEIPNLFYFKRLDYKAYKVALKLKKPKKLNNRAKLYFLINYKDTNIQTLESN